MFLAEIKYTLFFLILICVSAVVSAQDVPFIQNKPVPPDTINNNVLQNITADSLDEYEIIYEYDTIRQTKIITDYDTIIIIDSLKAKENIKKTDSLKPVISNNDIATETPDITKHPKEKYFTKGLHFSTFIYSNNLSANDSSANTHFYYRKTYEKPLPSFSLALTAGYHINRWSIQSGLQYSLLRNKINCPFQNEKFETLAYMQDSTYLGWINDTIDWYYQINNSGDTNWIPVVNHVWGTVHDSIPKTKIDTTIENLTKKGIQYYHFIEIPLIFGYEFVHLKKLSLEIKTGLITSFLIYRKGEIMSDKDSQTFISLSDYPFVSTFFSGYMGLGINYAINKKMNIEIHPYYQKGMTSILQKNFSLSQNMDKKGVYVGVRYKL